MNFNSVLFRRWFGNSFANLFGGMAGAGVNLLLPFILAKYLSSQDFATWNLSSQMLVYVGLLGLGMQTAISRAIAHAGENVGPQRLFVIYKAGLSIANIASLIAIAVLVGFVLFYPLIFDGLDEAGLIGFRLTMFFFGITAIAQILAQVYMGVFQGLHRNYIYVLIQTVVRLLAVLLIWVGVYLGWQLIALAGIFAFMSALQLPFIRWAFREFVSWAKLPNFGAIDGNVRVDLLKYCGTLSVWSVSMIFVNSFGLIVVARMDFLMAGPYSIAMTAASVLVGLLGALLSPLMTTSAALYGDANGRLRLPALLIKSTMGVVFLLNMLFLFVAYFNEVIIHYWVGDKFIPTLGPLLIVLVGAHCIRNMAAPYSLMLLGAGLHQRALFSAVLEGVVNFVASVLFGLRYGAVGVAAGTLFASCVGLLGCLLFNSFRTPELSPRPLRLLFVGILVPFILFSPAYIYLVVRF